MARKRLSNEFTQSTPHIGISFALPRQAKSEQLNTKRPMKSFTFESVISIQVGPFTLGQLTLSFLIILMTLILRGVIVKGLFASLRKLASRTKMEHDDHFVEVLERPAMSFLLVLGIYLAMVVLPLDAEWQTLIQTGFRGLSILIVFWALFRMVDVLVDLISNVYDGSESSSFRGFGGLVKKSLRAFIIVVGSVMVMDNMGYNIGGIIATLGIGGAAFAFAAKDSIANLYGSLALALDRPFSVGDWIQVGDTVDGDVEEIGLRSTKVRTWPKTIISIPNAVLANEMINNWSRMPKRRVKQVVGVTYETPPETMDAIVEGIRDLLRNDPDVNQEFILVNWTDFGASSLDILVYYFTSTTKWLEYMDIRQRINGGIVRVVAAHKSSIAFPTRTLHLEGQLAERIAGQALPGDAGPQAPL
jgi:MscS family membrane protein